MHLVTFKAYLTQVHRRWLYRHSASKCEILKLKTLPKKKSKTLNLISQTSKSEPEIVTSTH